MDPCSFDGFDPARYAHIPDLAGPRLLALARALLSRAPDRRQAAVDRALDEILAAIHELESLVHRLHGRTCVPLGEETDLVVALDGVWIDLHDRLRGRLSYAQPALIRLAVHADASICEVDYAVLVEHAGRARVLLSCIFGPDGSFTRCEDNRQYARMSAQMLDQIETHRIAGELEQLLGEDLVAVLRDLQRHVERVLAQRPHIAIESALSEAPRVRLRQAVRLYVISVLGMIDRQQPETLEPVQRSLAPLLRAHVGEHDTEPTLGASTPDSVSCA